MSDTSNELLATAKDLTAGTIGACAGIITGQPLDTIKTRYQVSRHKYINIIDCFNQTIRYEGIHALYKGMLSPLLGNAPLNMIVFGTNGNMNRTLNKYYPDNNNTTNQPNYYKLYISGTYAGAAQCIVCTPVELVKCRMQVQQNNILPTTNVLHITNSTLAPIQPNITLQSNTTHTQYKGSIDCARQIYRQYGIRGLYRGWWSEFWRDAPSYGLWFVAYEYVKYTLTPHHMLHSPTTTTLLLAGSAAGIATWVVTYPFDVIKSVVQASPDNTPPHQLKISYIARTHYNQYGIRWFYTGIGTTLIRAVPVSAVTFLVYERLMSYFNSTPINDHTDHTHDAIKVTK